MNRLLDRIEKRIRLGHLWLILAIGVILGTSFAMVEAYLYVTHERVFCGFLIEHLIILATCFVFYHFLRRCKQLPRLPHDRNIIPFFIIWLLPEAINHQIVVQLNWGKLNLTDLFFPIVFSFSTSLVVFRSYKSNYFILLILFASFTPSFALSDSPWLYCSLFSVTIAISMVIARMIWQSVSNASGALVIFAEELTRKRRVESRIRILHTRCRYVGLLADQLNSPLLVLTNCFQNLERNHQELRLSRQMHILAQLRPLLLECTEISRDLSSMRELSDDEQRDSCTLPETTTLIASPLAAE